MAREDDSDCQALGGPRGGGFSYNEAWNGEADLVLDSDKDGVSEYTQLGRMHTLISQVFFFLLNHLIPLNHPTW